MSVLRIGSLSLVHRPRAVAASTACALVALAAALFAIASGSGDYPMTAGDVLRTLLGTGVPADEFIVREVRLPRAATALLVGASLALGGAVFQSVVRNPLGSPDILGFTSGSATGALTTVVLLGGGSAALAAGAVAGGALTGLAVALLSWRQGMHGYRLILIGIGMTALLTGVNGYLLTRAQLLDAGRAVLWITGSLDGRGWENVLPLLVALAVLLPLVLLGCSRPLRMLEMGDDTAASLGVATRKVRVTVLAAAVLLVSFAAAAAGPVAFVALTAPQLARRLTRAPGPNLLPALCLGAALMVLADLAAQRLVPGHTLPVGVVTGVLGGGYLVWLLATERRAGRL
ncbi:FecCD family ABC transporter permease [Streptomyces sp. TR06-5]|uniref:FecCD family ABC transporter permease n=1 Tax=unclassified Streptomyces TaxID=2593676 RepID=UPI0039A00BEE